MDSTITVNYTWEREAVLAKGTDRVHLLVEWGCGSVHRDKAASQPHLIGYDLQLRIIPASGVRVIHMRGPKVNLKQDGNEQENVFRCGHLFNGKPRHAIFTFSFDKHDSGKKSVAMMEWSWHTSLTEKRTIVRTESIDIQFTYHLGLLQDPVNPRVVKVMSLDESSGLLKKILRFYDKGKRDEASWMLRRRAEILLLMAARTGDPDYLYEAEIFLDLQRQWDKTYGKAIYCGS